eukprot:COSAG02_NODE_4247_length_5587_cov_2.359147_3_plen_71_part_00
MSRGTVGVCRVALRLGRWSAVRRKVARSFAAWAARRAIAHAAHEHEFEVDTAELVRKFGTAGDAKIGRAA